MISSAAFKAFHQTLHFAGSDVQRERPLRVVIGHCSNGFL